MMESSDYAPPRMDPSRPSLGFPLGTALLLIVIFTLSGLFSCCYHWDKLKSLRRSFHPDADLEAADHHDHGGLPSKPQPTYTGSKDNQNQSLPVIMPGDRIAKFIALPCPCEPPRPPGRIVVQVQPPVPKPPRIVVPLN